MIDPKLVMLYGDEEDGRHLGVAPVVVAGIGKALKSIGGAIFKGAKKARDARKKREAESKQLAMREKERVAQLEQARLLEATERRKNQGKIILAGAAVAAVFFLRKKGTI